MTGLRPMPRLACENDTGAITASADPGALQTLPKHPATDSVGLPMEMVYAATPR